VGFPAYLTSLPLWVAQGSFLGLQFTEDLHHTASFTSSLSLLRTVSASGCHRLLPQVLECTCLTCCLHLLATCPPLPSPLPFPFCPWSQACTCFLFYLPSHYLRCAFLATTTLSPASLPGSLPPATAHTDEVEALVDLWTHTACRQAPHHTTSLHALLRTFAVLAQTSRITAGSISRSAVSRVCNVQGFTGAGLPAYNDTVLGCQACASSAYRRFCRAITPQRRRTGLPRPAGWTLSSRLLLCCQACAVKPQRRQPLSSRQRRCGFREYARYVALCRRARGTLFFSDACAVCAPLVSSSVRFARRP